MRFRSLATTIALLATVAGSHAGAQEVAGILDKYAAAFGGKPKIMAMKEQHMTGRISFGKSGGALTIDRLAPNKSRMDMVLNNQHLARGFDGSRAWQAVDGNGGRVDVLSGSDVRNLAVESDFYGPLIEPKAAGNDVQLIGRKMIRSKNTYKLQVVLNGPGGYVDYYYLDPTTYLPMRWEGNRLISGRMQTFTSDYLEYKTFGGYPFPTQIITQSPDGNAQAILIDDVKINQVVDPTRFNVPTMSGGRLH